ncbi:MAG: hypothetical protein Q9166_007321 [cf. Caloplaca sp. 2 TL-2023]
MSITKPPVRACIFDVDGLLINSEDIYTDIYNKILFSYNKPALKWTTKALQQSRGAIGHERLISSTNLPLTVPEFRAQVATHHQPFTESQPLPGVLALIQKLSAAHPPIHLAMASSTTRPFFATKTSHLPSLTSHFSIDRCLFSDDEDMKTKKGKPAGDIFLLAMERINASLAAGDQKLKPEECLVFEDSIAGIAAGRAAGMRVCWVPHEGLREVCRGLEKDVLAGKMEEVEERLLALEAERAIIEPKTEVKMDEVAIDWRGKVETIESEDGWAEMIGSLEDFNYDRYGIEVKA